MELTFLGTSASMPTRARNVTGLAVQHGGPRQWYLIDCGEATQHQLLRTRLSVVQLQAIFITHVHGDHTFGLPGLLASASMAGRTEPLPIVGPAGLKPYIEAALGNTDSALSYPLQFIVPEPDSLCWQDAAIEVTAVPLSHRVPCNAFRLRERNPERQLRTDRLEADGIAPGPVWGALQKGQSVELDNGQVLQSDDYTRTARAPRVVVVAGDNDRPDCLAAACQGAHLLVHEATYTQAISDKVGPWPQHSSAAAVARFAEDTGLPALILTHFSSRYQFPPKKAGQKAKGPLIDEIEQEAREYYRKNLFLARDFDHYRIDRDGEVSLLNPR